MGEHVFKVQPPKEAYQDNIRNAVLLFEQTTTVIAWYEERKPTRCNN